ncbi:short-chain dehydrogenase [Pandoraea terrae]|uniref:Short-chain dehydrogenase n=1 Tax=Pandoraea terrae TaxID=1537710 RepID=A0A5E4YU18_9BURK|nr:SDR family oxidoreductase [Pandoraea terrae]VVE52331.1 short-chain dehydrogenase [Pandoraea terrae]
MGIVAVSGAAGGMGRALRAVLEASGERVVGIDLHGAEIIADLATPAGRATAIAEVGRHCGGRLDGLVCAAGLGGTVRPASRTVAVNYFGAVALLDGLFPLLKAAPHPAALAISSVAATSGPWQDHPLEQTCLSGDEDAAQAMAEASRTPNAAYGCSKRALAVYVRRLAKAWGQAGVRLNAIAPGPTDTALHPAAVDDEVPGPAAHTFVPPLGYTAAAEEIAQTIAFLLSTRSSFIHGSVLFVDGGCDAALRPDRF